MVWGVFLPQTRRRNRYHASRYSAPRGLQRHATAERVSGNIDRQLDADLPDGLFERFNEVRNGRRRSSRKWRCQSKSGRIEGDHMTRGA